TSKEWSSPNVSPNKAVKRRLDFLFPLIQRFAGLRPGTYPRCQVSGEDAPARHRSNHIDLRQDTQLVKPSQRPEMEQGSAEAASRKAECDAIIRRASGGGQRRVSLFGDGHVPPSVRRGAAASRTGFASARRASRRLVVVR